MTTLTLRLTSGEEETLVWHRGDPPARLKVSVSSSRSNIGEPDLRLRPFNGKDFVKQGETLIYLEETP